MTWVSSFFTDIYKFLVIFNYISLHQGQKDTEVRTKKDFSVPFNVFVLFLQFYLLFSSSDFLGGSEVSRLHFHPSLEKTSMSHVKYLLGDSVFLSLFSLFLVLTFKAWCSELNIQPHLSPRFPFLLLSVVFNELIAILLSFGSSLPLRIQHL